MDYPLTGKELAVGSCQFSDVLRVLRDFRDPNALSGHSDGVGGRPPGRPYCYAVHSVDLHAVVGASGSSPAQRRCPRHRGVARESLKPIIRLLG